MSDTKRKPDLNLYVVSGTKEKPFYTKLGAIWENKDGSFGGECVILGKIYLSRPKAKDEDVEAG